VKLEVRKLRLAEDHGVVHISVGSHSHLFHGDSQPFPLRLPVCDITSDIVLRAFANESDANSSQVRQADHDQTFVLNILRTASGKFLFLCRRCFRCAATAPSRPPNGFSSSRPPRTPPTSQRNPYASPLLLSIYTQAAVFIFLNKASHISIFEFPNFLSRR